MNRADAGVSAVIDFIVGIGVFLVVIGLFVAFGPLVDRPSGGRSRQAVAEGLLDSVVSRPGLGEGTGVDWQTAPEKLTLLGLRSRQGSLLQHTKIAALANGTDQADPGNGAVDYPEARRALGLQNLEVHYDVLLQLRPVPVRNASSYDTDLIEEADVAYVRSEDNPVQGTREIAMLNATAVRFDPSEDVYDDGRALDLLVRDLSGYDVIVVGSGADHAELARHGLSSALDDWVRGGGGLVVLGSEDAKAAWLKPIVGGSLATSTVSDLETFRAGDPLVALPHGVDLSTIDPRSSGSDWEVWDGGDEPIVRVEGEADAPDDGSYSMARTWVGNGVVVMTTYRWSGVQDQHDRDHAREFAANHVHLGATGVTNLDYGRAPPFDSRSSTATRQTIVSHARIGAVRTRVSMTVWGG